jgi:hypothetical protein
MAKKTKPRVFLRIRSYPNVNFVDIWMMREDGAVQSWMMHGEVLPEVAEACVEATKLPVEREESPCRVQRVKVPVPSPETPNLFQGV